MTPCRLPDARALPTVPFQLAAGIRTWVNFRLAGTKMSHPWGWPEAIPYRLLTLLRTEKIKKVSKHS